MSYEVPGVAALMVLCTVRGCSRPLTWGERTCVCDAGHSFDRSRHGYLNLLQPQDRRSRNPGDSRDVVSARRLLHDAGIGRTFVQRFADLAREVASDARSSILDVGCGEGTHLESMVRTSGAEGWGIDISASAIELASRRHPHLSWIVCNADRMIPFGDESFTLVSSITSRLPRLELARVLNRSGYLLAALPGADDLIELRGAVQASGVLRDRVSDAQERLAPELTLVHSEHIEERASLSAELLRALLATTYRGQRRSEEDRVASLQEMAVTSSRDVLLFRRSH